jgi:hypothetical protein
MPVKKTSSIPGDIITVYDKITGSIKEVERKGATMPYTSVNGHMFSFLAADGSMGLRLPAESREAFIKKHKTKLCEAHGTVLKEYVSVPGKLFKDTAAMKVYFKESYEYVSSLKPKATTKTAKKTKK